MEEFDFVVVGAGSSGGPIVDRLTASGRYRVLLLEAGPDDTCRWLSIPFGFTKTVRDPQLNWSFVTEPEAQLDGRRVDWPSGKVIGGSSAINGMVYVRGMSSDYDGWQQLGNEGWSFDDCLPYFKRLEAYSGGDSDLHGRDGPVAITQGEYYNEMSISFLDACAELGLPLVDNLNGHAREGAGLYHATISKGRRVSTGQAYIAPARRRANCRVETGAMVERIDVVDGRATGVTYRKDGKSTGVRARCEVVVCAGAVGSPKLLQLSGIGPAVLLGGYGIPLVRDLPGVGENLQDHWGVRSVYQTWWRLTLNDDTNLPQRRWCARSMYIFKRSGPLTASSALAGAFVRLLPQSTEPDTQFHFLPWSTYGIDQDFHQFSGITILSSRVPEAEGMCGSRRRIPTSIRRSWPTTCRPIRTERQRWRPSSLRACWPARPRSAVSSLESSCPASRSPGIPVSSTMPAARASLPATPSAPAAWATTRAPWSMPGCESMALPACASPTPRSCRPWYQETPMPPA